MFVQIDETIYNLIRVVQAVENDILDIAGSADEKHDFDFVGIHNISKHVIYLMESSNAAVATATRVCEQHRELMEKFQSDPTSLSMRAVHEILTPHCILSNRNLMAYQAFNTVNQRDSRAMRQDGQAMKAIAIMTMVFLPVTAVAGIYGSAFFVFDSGSQGVVTARDFGTFWIITSLLTLAVFVIYGLWLLRRADNVPTRLRGWLGNYLKSKELP
ncbi:MAG: hypothetical protein Q9187_005562 [Circinaria calcarea]